MEDKIVRTLDAMEHPENFRKEELDVLLGDKECVRICRDILDSREALARRYATAPDIEAEWQFFKERQGLCQASVQPKKRKRMLYISIALSVAASVILFLLLRPSIPQEYTVFSADLEAQVISIETKNGMHTLHIPRGMNKLLVLPDSSRVWLNAESTLQYPESFDGKKQREVYLKGEGYFEVTKDAEHPFMVKTDALKTQVLGTSFNVCAYREDEAASVVLVRGSVEVTTENKSKVRLAPNQLVDIKGNKTQVRKVDVSEYISWKDNLLLLHQRPVGDVLKKLERYYGCKIRYDAEITTLSLSGKLDLQTDITNVMDNLCLSLSLHYTINDKDEIYVSLK